MNRDVMQASGLSIYAEIGIICFVLAFALVALRVYMMKKSEAEACGHIPLEDGSEVIP